MVAAKHLFLETWRMINGKSKKSRKFKLKMENFKYPAFNDFIVFLIGSQTAVYNLFQAFLWDFIESLISGYRCFNFFQIFLKNQFKLKIEKESLLLFEVQKKFWFKKLSCGTEPYNILVVLNNFSIYHPERRWLQQKRPKLQKIKICFERNPF